MEQLKCPNCGGNINRAKMVCEYCGTQFKKDHETNDYLRIETFRPGIEVLKARIIIPHGFVCEMGEEDVATLARKEMVKQIAESLDVYMDVRSSFDIARFEHHIEGQIRVARPDYRF